MSGTRVNWLLYDVGGAVRLSIKLVFFLFRFSDHSYPSIPNFLSSLSRRYKAFVAYHAKPPVALPNFSPPPPSFTPFGISEILISIFFSLPLIFLPRDHVTDYYLFVRLFGWRFPSITAQLRVAQRGQVRSDTRIAQLARVSRLLMSCGVHSAMRGCHTLTMVSGAKYGFGF